jgi:hypothetical protein
MLSAQLRSTEGRGAGKNGDPLHGAVLPGPCSCSGWALSLSFLGVMTTSLWMAAASECGACFSGAWALWDAVQAVTSSQSGKGQRGGGPLVANLWLQVLRLEQGLRPSIERDKNLVPTFQFPEKPPLAHSCLPNPAASRKGLRVRLCLGAVIGEKEVTMNSAATSKGSAQC